VRGDAGSARYGGGATIRGGFPRGATKKAGPDVPDRPSNREDGGDQVWQDLPLIVTFSPLPLTLTPSPA
jgi:hypothetical protein